MTDTACDGTAPAPGSASRARRADAATIDALRAAIAAVPAGGTPEPAAPRRTPRPGRRARETSAEDSGSTERSGSTAERGASRPAPTEVEDAAREYLLRSLTASARSRKQLADGLASRDVPADVAERLLDRFTDVGLVDDAALAQAIVRTRSQETGAARRRIATELRRKGIAPDVAADALAQVDDEDERRSAFDLAHVRARRLVGLERDVALRRLVGFLGRKGYPPSVCLDAARAGLERALDGSIGTDAVD